MYTTKRPLTSISKGSHIKIGTTSKGVETERAGLFKSTFQEPKIGEDLDFDAVSKKTYDMALNYINYFHIYMNTKLREQNGEHGDAKCSDEHCFKFPEIPNYCVLFPKFLYKSHQIYKDPVDEKPIKKVIKEHNIKKIEDEAKNLVRNQEVKNKVDEKPCRDTSPANKPIGLNGCLKYPSISVKPEIPKDVALPEIPKDYNLPIEINECLSQVFTYDKTKKETVIYTEKRVRLEKTSFNVVDIQPQLIYYPMWDQHESHEFFAYTKKKSSDPERRVKLETSSFCVVNIQPQMHFVESNESILNINEKHTNLKSIEVSSKVIPTTPKRVKEMFEKISKDQCATNYSDSDSEIMDDEQFEMASQFRYPFSRPEAVTKHKKKSSATTSEKSHPLKLNNKDLPKLNEKILNAIGIFTERGDMRPGIIDVIEQHRLAKSNDRRNKQFRVKRQWDIQIHLQPKQGTDGSSLSSISSSSSLRTEMYCREVEE